MPTLTEKEQKTLMECLDRLAVHEREDVFGAILKCNRGDLEYQEVSDLIAKLLVPGFECTNARCGACPKCRPIVPAADE